MKKEQSVTLRIRFENKRDFENIITAMQYLRKTGFHCDTGSSDEEGKHKGYYNLELDWSMTNGELVFHEVERNEKIQQLLSAHNFLKARYKEIDKEIEAIERENPGIKEEYNKFKDQLQ